MRYFILISVMLLSGCAQIQRATSRDGMTTDERTRATLAREAEDRETQRLRDALAPGASAERVKAAWGEPDTIEFKAGLVIWRYEGEETPIVFTFKDQVLYEKYLDRETGEQRKAAALEERRARARAIGEALHSFGNSMQQSRPVNCTSYQTGSVVQTSCH